MQLQGNKTVLLVEDEAPRAAETCARLRDFGYAVLSAPSGEKALEVLATKQGIDLVLLDIDLGLGREGPSMASRILGSRDLPLVLLASHSGQEPVEKLEGITRYGYVVKDSGEAALRSTIETAFELFEARRRAEKEAGESRLLFQDLKADFAATDKLMKLIQGCEGRDELMKRVLSFMRDISGCEAVGIRLSLDGDYPYYVHRGFPEDFIRTERSLCARDPEGAIIRDEIGNPVLDCMCGNILCGRFDPSKPFFTQGGSFWSSCTTELLASTTEEDRQARTRNRCHGEGYESVALIPLRSGATTYGLIQLNDRKRGAFTEGRIAFFEHLANCVTYALSEKIARDRLMQSEERYGSIIRASMDGFLVADEDARLIDVNDEYCRMTGFTREDLLKLRIGDLGPTDKTRESSLRHKELILKNGSDRFESKHRRVDGSFFDAEFSVYVTSGLGRYLCFVRDISERKANEARIANLLKEKETLIKEVHHRIKNNLNTVESLLSLQASQAADPASSMILKEAESRLRSMGLLYDKFYRSESVANLPVKYYLPALVAEILSVFPNPDLATAETITDELILPAKILSTIGILTNELITNAMKHAFVGRKGGKIRVSLTGREGRVLFSVEDDGCGMPQDHAAAPSSGLGLRLVSILADQLKATLSRESGKGTKVSLEFKIEGNR